MRPVIRLIGLFHDLTHAPYGHTIEDEIHLISCKHDEPKRQADVFYRLTCQYIGWLAREAGLRRQHEKYQLSIGNVESSNTIPDELWDYVESPTSEPPKSYKAVAALAVGLLTSPSERAVVSWRLAPSDIAILLAQMRCAMRALLYLDILHAKEVTEQNCPQLDKYDFELLIEEALQLAGKSDLQSTYAFEPSRDAYALDIVGNTVCADLLDYAQRDAHFASLKLGYDADRIAENFTLVSWDPAKPAGNDEASRRTVLKADPFRGKSIRTGISLFSHKLRTDVPSELMNLLNVRFYLYERALFHPTKCAAGAMLLGAWQE